LDAFIKIAIAAFWDKLIPNFFCLFEMGSFAFGSDTTRCYYIKYSLI